MVNFRFVSAQIAQHLHEDWSKACPEIRKLGRDGSQFVIWIGGFATAAIGLLVHEAASLSETIGWIPIGVALLFLAATLVLVIVHRHFYIIFEHALWGHHFWLLNQLQIRSRESFVEPPELGASMSDNEVADLLVRHFEVHPDRIALLKVNPEHLRADYLATRAIWLQGDHAGHTAINQIVSIFDGRYVNRDGIAGVTEEEIDSASESLQKQQAKTGASLKLQERRLGILQIVSISLFTLALASLSAGVLVTAIASTPEPTSDEGFDSDPVPSQATSTPDSQDAPSAVTPEDVKD